MHRTIVLHIESGDKTCASSPGVFCPHLRVNYKGHQCGLFQNTSASVFGKVLLPQLQDVDGWLQRLPECLEAERKAIEASSGYVNQDVM